MIEDPTAIPESAEAATEYLAAANDAFMVQGDNAAALVLAHSVSESSYATDPQRAEAYMMVGVVLEGDGRVDDAIVAYSKASDHGNPTGDAEAKRLLGGEQTGLVEAGRSPVNEAEANLYFTTGKAAFEAKDYERAHDVLLALYNSEVNNADQKGQAALFLGTILKDEGRSADAAYGYFREAAEIGDSGTREAALRHIAAYSAQDGNADAGRDTPSSDTLADAEAVATMLTAAVDRYNNGDVAGAESRFNAAHSAGVATAEQKGYAAYYLGLCRWHSNDYDNARVFLREAKAAGGDTAANAADMLQTHWQE